MKVALPYGPADGAGGFRKTLEMVEQTRNLVGPDGDIMLGLLRGLGRALCHSARQGASAIQGDMDGRAGSAGSS